MSRWLVRGVVAWSLHMVSAEDVPELLASDSECVSDSECSLNALQLNARARAEGPKAAAWSQCGGKKWEGATVCADGSECFKVDDWYSQCRPKATTGVPAPSAKPQAAPAPQTREKPSKPSSVEPEEAEEPEEPSKPEAAMHLPKRPPQPKPKIYDTVNPIISRGNFLYDSVTGKRFFAKGVAYNPRNEHYQHNFGPSVQLPGWVDKCIPGEPEGGYRGYSADVQTDDLEDYWSADLEAMANMGANTVRLYNIDPQKSHAKFMKKAHSLGLYVIVPLTGKDWGFLPAFPAPDCYTQEIEEYGNVGTNVLAFAKTVMKEFAPYNNTLLFTAANELAQLDKNGYAAFPCVKAFVRDLHNYQEECSSTMRRVPLIYSDVDTGGGAARKVVADYLTCALDSEADAVDAYGLNVYSWCDETYPGDGKADNFQYSPYKDIKKDFKDFSVPFIFSEFGCNLGVFKTKCPYPDGRTWPDVKHFLGEDMGEFMSGAVAFQWSMDKEEYGLTLSPGFLAGQDELYLLDNYFNLQKVYKKYQVNSTWDAPAAKVDKCGFVPEDVAPLEEPHKRPACPSKALWTKVQTQRGVDKVVDWTVLPPPANAPIGNATLNISECSADPGHYIEPPPRYQNTTEVDLLRQARSALCSLRQRGMDAAAQVSLPRPIGHAQPEVAIVSWEDGICLSEVTRRPAFGGCYMEEGELSSRRADARHLARTFWLLLFEHHIALGGLCAGNVLLRTAMDEEQLEVVLLRCGLCHQVDAETIQDLKHLTQLLRRGADSEEVGHLILTRVHCRSGGQAEQVHDLDGFFSSINSLLGKSAGCGVMPPLRGAVLLHRFLETLHRHKLKASEVHLQVATSAAATHAVCSRLDPFSYGGLFEALLEVAPDKG